MTVDDLRDVDPIHAALLDGRSFTVSEAEDAGSSTSHNLALENPTDSGVLLLVYFAEATHEDEVEIIIYDEISNTSGGADPHINNNLIGSPRTTKANLNHDLSFTGDNIHQEQVYTGAGTETLFNGYRVLVKEGESIVIEQTDQSGGADEMGIRLSFVELTPAI